MKYIITILPTVHIKYTDIKLNEYNKTGADPGGGPGGLGPTQNFQYQ